MSFMTVGMGRLGRPIVVQPSPFNQYVQSGVQGYGSWDFIKHVEHANVALSTWSYIQLPASNRCAMTMLANLCNYLMDIHA
jgi:hypothetical protein